MQPPPKQRLDHYLTKQYPDISRGFLQKLIATDQVLVNGEPQKSGYKLAERDKVQVLYDMEAIGKVPDIELPVVYEDENILVVNKPSGVLSHALTKFHDEPSVASFLRQHMKQIPDGDTRFGIVHRLDRATSGVMVCAKNQETLSHLQKQFGARTVKKTYNAVVSGHLDLHEAVIDIPLERNPNAPATYRPGKSGKSAITEYKVLSESQARSLVSLHPLTGRTHQLRVHLQHLKHPIVGDVLYGGETAERLFLHALEITLDYQGKAHTFTAPLPAEFKKQLL